MSVMSPDYIEAVQIIKGQTALLPEKRHLEAIEEHYQSEVIAICHQLNQFTTMVLQRN
jgi:hypothetical protein